MKHRCDIAIVGAGAAGLAAGIFAGEAAREAGRPRRIVALDGAAKVGAKILVSGGGRCNVTHDRVTPEDFHGNRNIVRNVLRGFDERATVAWFERLGVTLKTEPTGKLFPTTDAARTVLDALLRRLEQLDVRLASSHRVRRIDRPADGAGPFVVHHQHGRVEADRVILAAGGRSLPRSGSDGSGHALAEQLGHTVTPTYPALVPLVLDKGFFHAFLSGVSHDVQLTTRAGGKLIDQRTGSLLWTHFGISGPVVMDASRHWCIAQGAGQRPTMTANLLAGASGDEVEAWLIERSAASGRRQLLPILADRLPRRVAAAVLTHVDLPGTLPSDQLARYKRRRLVEALTQLALPVTGDRGWNHAETTAGGVPLNQIAHATLASRRCDRLYVIGEVLDCDGRIGGFNFQWAWASGHLAGRAAVHDSPH